MDTFRYYGRNRRGEAMRGSVEAPSAQAVAQWLMETQIAPVSIMPDTPASYDPEWFTKLTGQRKIAIVDLMMFTRQMGNMVRAGLPMMDSIVGIQRSTGNKVLAKVLQAVRDDLDRGSDLGTALSHHPAVFSEYYVSMVRVGENSGELERAFKALYQQLEFDRHVKQKTLSALRYPTFVLIAIVAAVGILSIFVIPAFAKTYAGLHAQLPLLTRVLLAVSSFSVQFWWLILLAGAGLVYLVRLFLATDEGRYLWDKLKLKLPAVGVVVVKASMGRFCSSFSTAIRSGVPLVQAFQLVSKVVDNAFYADRILQMRQGVERGDSLSRVMVLSGIFSPLELQMITVAEASGDIGNALEQMALMYQEDVDYEVSRLSQTIEPLLLLVMGLLVGTLLLGVFMPMWELGQAAFKARH
jgi:MSHA biogenesis protein MshG